MAKAKKAQRRPRSRGADVPARYRLDHTWENFTSLGLAAATGRPGALDNLMRHIHGQSVIVPTTPKTKSGSRSRHRRQSS